MYLKIINKYYKNNPDAKEVLLKHSSDTWKKAQEIIKLNPKKKLDKTFIKNACFLHDIGIIFTIPFGGDKPYMDHLKLGFDLLTKEGLPKLANICLIHTGIFKDTIIKNNYALPKKNLIPKTNEEKVVYLADKFFTKSNMDNIRTIEEINSYLKKWDKKQQLLFVKIAKEFNLS